MLSLGDGQPCASESAECPIASVWVRRILWNASKKCTSATATLSSPSEPASLRADPPALPCAVLNFRKNSTRPPTRHATTAYSITCRSLGLQSIGRQHHRRSPPHYPSHAHPLTTHTYNSAFAKRAERKKSVHSHTCEVRACYNSTTRLGLGFTRRRPARPCPSVSRGGSSQTPRQSPP